MKDFNQICAEQHRVRNNEINHLLQAFGQPIEESENCNVKVNQEHSVMSPEVANIAYNTYANWTDFDAEEETPSLPTNEGEKPWNNITDLVLGKRLSQMTLSPNLPRKPSTSPNNKSIIWSDIHQKAMNELLEEASKLIKIFDEIFIMLGPRLPFLVSPPKSPNMQELQFCKENVAKRDIERLERQLKRSAEFQ